VLVVAIIAGAALLTAPAALAASAQPATFTATGSVDQVYVTGLPARAQASLISSSGATLSTQTADSLGGLLFRGVAPGSGYQVQSVADGSESGPVTVYSAAAAPWDPSIYDQSIPNKGYGYLTTRDGTQLAIDVRPPLTAGAKPPYPTLIEYSGYAYADPAQPQHGLALVAQLMGFAVVDVNMRGTGCSGGAFADGDPLQNLDGYDVIETIANQPWVLGNKVGMIGISYGGDTQLPVAALDPPDLEAIAPLSVHASEGAGIYVGGIFNTGGGVPLALNLQSDAEPAGPFSGEPYAYQRIKQGDQTCKANQILHGDATNVLTNMAANTYYNPAVDDPLDAVTFVNQITVPTFMACEFEDELAGGYCPALVQNFTGTNLKWFTFENGAHIDALDPYTLDRWYDFLQLFVAHQAPSIDAAALRAEAPLMYSVAFGIKGVTLPADPIQSQTYAAALAAFEALPEVRVLFDNGAGPSPSGTVTAGNPYPAFEQSFSSFPPPGTVAGYWYLGPSGTLTNAPPSTSGVDSYTSNAKALPLTDYPSLTFTGGIWANASAWKWNWQQYPAGSAVSYVSAPLSSNTTVIGGGAVDIWVESSTPNVDFQATISEVRPDGNEEFVQNGWLRANERALSTTTDNWLHQPSTTLEPVPSYTAADVNPMPSGQFAEVDIPLYFEGHVYRAGSRIRVTIAAPNGTQPVWSFNQTQPTTGTATESIAFSPSMASSLILPVVPGVAVPTSYPPCPSLRNEPCRPYVPITNTGS
jgi:predicted acyl esterase